MSRRVLVVDDEPLARQRLVRFLANADATLVVEEAANGLDAVEALLARPPDVVFLDIAMPGLSGLDVLRQLPGYPVPGSQRPFHVVFQTAFDRFAVAAFEEEACDYLVKPFTEARFRASLERALARSFEKDRLTALEERLARRDGALRKLAVRIGRRLVLLAEADVVALVSRDHVTCVHAVDGSEGTTDLSLSALEGRLDDAVFKRVHRGHLVNAAHVTSLVEEGDGLRVTLSTGLSLPVARRFRAAARALAGGR